MTVIPVIDLLQGRAVLAQRGQRRHYQPVNSPLCEQGDVLPLVERLTTRFRFNILYIADLDAIQGNGDNTALIDTLSAHHRDLQIWLDAGFDGPDALRRMSTACRCRPVVGSETWQHGDPLPDHRCLLSIDLDRHGLRDPSGIAADPSRYPRDVV
ncbi:MAG: histidine biosynthesis protein, partial [Gammaproteobacteria bacterium]|nr:histidine biosynthesis protein [Gammaproteobacteria bacterium]